MVADFVDSALAAIPPGILARVARPRVDLIGEFADEETTSEWKEFAGEVKITVATASLDPHDVGMEVLVCLGQALWEHLTDSERKRYLRLLSEELV